MHEDFDAFEGDEQVAPRRDVSDDQVDRPLAEDRRGFGRIADEAAHLVPGVERGSRHALSDEARRAGDQHPHPLRIRADAALQPRLRGVAASARIVERGARAQRKPATGPMVLCPDPRDLR